MNGMRIRTSFSIVVLVGAFVAIPLYFVMQSERVAESPAAGIGVVPPPAGDADVRETYCAERTSANGVIVSTGTGCANRTDSAGPHPLTVTVTQQPDALVITGSDP